jgi:hypothetical protein
MFGRIANLRMRNVRCLTPAVLATAIVLSSCSTVINDTTSTEAPEDTVAISTSTTIPSGDITTLLNQLVITTNGLGEAIANRQDDQARQQAADASAIWIALQPQLLDSGIDVVEDLDRMVRLVQTAVERKRPADADKAFRFISLIAKEIPTLL